MNLCNLIAFSLREIQTKLMQKDLNSFPLENWRIPPKSRIPLYYLPTWMKTMQQDLKSTLSRRKQLTWLRSIHSGAWCLRLALCTCIGACHKRRNK